MLNFPTSKLNSEVISAAMFSATKKARLASVNDVDTFCSHNLFHFLKKKLYSINEIIAFVANLSDDERYVGYLPDNWRKKINDEDISKTTLEIQKILSDFAQKSASPKEKPISELSVQADDLAKQLEKYFGECKVKPYRMGSIGKVFRIQCADEDLALKVFHNNPTKGFTATHGQIKEIANAIYLNRILKPDRCSRFYCGKIGLDGHNDAFMLTKFVKADNSKLQPTAKGIWKPERFYFSDDKMENRIGSTWVDFGAVSYNFDNINQREYAKELYRLIYSGDTKGIKRMQKLYAKDVDYSRIVTEIMDFMESEVDNPLGFGVSAKYYTKKEIQGYKALGIDFRPIKKFDYTNHSEECKEAVIKLGLQKSDNSIFSQVTNFFMKIFK